VVSRDIGIHPSRAVASCFLRHSEDDELKDQQHRAEILHIEKAHNNAVRDLNRKHDAEMSVKNVEIRQLKQDQENAKLTYEHRIHDLEARVEGMRDQHPRIRLHCGRLNGEPEFWVQNHGNSDGYDITVLSMHSTHGVYWPELIGCLCHDTKKTISYTVDNTNKGIETIFADDPDPMPIITNCHDGQNRLWSTSCKLNYDAESRRLWVDCEESTLPPPPRTLSSKLYGD
jgi:hypothetical protein